MWPDELNSIYHNVPFKKIDLVTEGAKILICFLSDIPDKMNLSHLREFLHPTERLVSLDKTLYLHCPNGSGKSKISIAVIERKLKLKSTARNLKTVAKLCELSKD